MKHESKKDKNYVQHIVYDDGSLTAVSLAAHSADRARSEYTLSVTMMTLTKTDDQYKQAAIKEVFTLNDWSRGDNAEDLIMDFMTLYETFDIFPYTKMVDEYTVFDFEGKMIEGMSVSDLCKYKGHNAGLQKDPILGMDPDRYLRQIPIEKTPKLVK